MFSFILGLVIGYSGKDILKDLLNDTIKLIKTKYFK